jgi:hypothetical protein
LFVPFFFFLLLARQKKEEKVNRKKKKEKHAVKWITTTHFARGIEWILRAKPALLRSLL